MNAEPSTALKPRILKNIQAEFERAEYPGSNESGVRPIGTSVLVLMDLVSVTTSGQAGTELLAEAGMKASASTAGLGIDLPPEKIEQMNIASETGVLISLGEAAFRFYGDGTKWTDVKPAPGDRVFVERYAGRQVLGRDGRAYRMMEYTCVAGIEESPQPNEEA
jgi:chaperonin GroES